MGVGDVNSDERGSGARFNDGKAPFQYMLVEDFREWALGQTGYWGESSATIDHEAVNEWEDFLAELAEFQTGQNNMPPHMSSAEAWKLEEMCHVFAFGAEKYASWNWAKGMNWSIPIACIMRHLLAIFQGEEKDPESGRAHAGHVYCNLQMLHHFVRYYPEGNDLPPPELFTDGDACD